MNEKYEIKRTQLLTLIALTTAVITTTTMIVKIPVPLYGYMNLGDAMIMLSAILLPVRGALFAAGVGSAIADIFLGYPQYALFTLFIKAFEVVIILLLKRFLSTKKYAVPFFAAGLAMALSYGIVDAVIYQSLEAGIASLTMNIPQGLISAGLATVLYPKFSKLIGHIRSLDS
ncbi:ECF transporter S component [Erysipelothrix aquatica]|uniref:ECF transporter S component n=1 Tax=Erysipelothrix aquatica TaxID=2683714 RepID=UPI00135AB313|nr:ECF transporter S component [Erysipelothrix aquatica]